MSLDNELWPESFDAMVNFDVDADPCHDDMPPHEDSTMLLSPGFLDLEPSRSYDSLFPTELMLNPSIQQRHPDETQPPLQPFNFEVSALTPTLHTGNEPFSPLQGPEATATEQVRKEEERRQLNLAIIKNKQAMLEAERDLIEFRNAHGLSATIGVDSQVLPAHPLPVNQPQFQQRETTAYLASPETTDLVSHSDLWPMTFEHPAALGDGLSTSGDYSAVNETAYNTGASTIVSPDIGFDYLGRHALGGASQEPPSSLLMAQQLNASMQLPRKTMKYRPLPAGSPDASISNGATASLIKRKRKDTPSHCAEIEAARLMKRVCAGGPPVPPMVAVFACSGYSITTPTKKTQAQLQKSRQVREAGGQCILCWMMKKPCSGQRPCERCLQYASKSTTYQWTCAVRTNWTDFSDLLCRGSSAMNVAQAKKAFAAAMAKLKTIPSEELGALNVVANIRPESAISWLDIYEQRLARRFGVDGQRQGRLARLVSAATTESLLPILSAWSIFAKDYLRWLDIAGDTLRATLEDVQRCSASIMLERAQTAGIARGDPFESLTALALIGAQRRETWHLNWNALTGQERERHQHLASAIETHHRYLAARVQHRNEDLVMSRDGRTMTWQDFLWELDYSYNIEVYLGLSSNLGKLTNPGFESATIPACAASGKETPIDDERSRCCCNIISKMIREDVLRFFGCSSGAIRSQLHASPLLLECVDGRVRQLPFQFDSDVILRSQPRDISDWHAVFNWHLQDWIDRFVRWHDRECSTAATGERLGGGVKRSLLLVVIVSALREMSLYDQFLTEAGDEHASLGYSLNAFYDWRRGRRRRKRVKKDVWRQAGCIFCVDDFEYDTDSEDGETEEDSDWDSSTDMDDECAGEGEDEDEGEDGNEYGSEHESNASQEHGDDSGSDGNTEHDLKGGNVSETLDSTSKGNSECGLLIDEHPDISPQMQGTR